MKNKQASFKDDPRLTAYALDEMEVTERAVFEELIRDNVEALAAVAEIQARASDVSQALNWEAAKDESLHRAADARAISQAAEMELKTKQQWAQASARGARGEESSVLQPYGRKVRLFPYFLIGGLAAACFAVVFVIQKPEVEYKDKERLARQEAEARYLAEQRVLMQATDQAEHAQEGHAQGVFAGRIHQEGDAFSRVADKPLSTFPFDVGTAGYADVRRFIQSGQLPPVEHVLIEELVNAFEYHYAPPVIDSGHAFAASLEIAAAPWNTAHRLVRIGIKGRESSDSSNTVAELAQDVRLQVEFNPDQTLSYRLIGYESHGQTQDKPDGDSSGHVDARFGQVITALYEVVPVSSQSNAAQGAGTPEPTSLPISETRTELLTLRIRYNEPRSEAREMQEFTLVDAGNGFPEASEDFKFASAVAGFGMVLRDSTNKGGATLESVLSWAESGLGTDADGSRHEFIDLVRSARTL